MENELIWLCIFGVDHLQNGNEWWKAEEIEKFHFKNNVRNYNEQIIIPSIILLHFQKLDLLVQLDDRNHNHQPPITIKTRITHSLPYVQRKWPNNITYSAFHTFDWHILIKPLNEVISDFWWLLVVLNEFRTEHQKHLFLECLLWKCVCIDDGTFVVPHYWREFRHLIK